MSEYFEVPVGDPQEATKCDFCEEKAEFVADNNASGEVQSYCAICEERRAEKYGCAMLLAEGATCEDGICGCGGKGVY